MTTLCSCVWDKNLSFITKHDLNCCIHNRPGVFIPVRDTNELLKTFSSGATRSTAEIRFDLIPREGLVRVVKAFEEGVLTHGEDNYKKGLPVRNLLNHALNHILLAQEGDKSEDHVSHAMANLFILCWMEENKPEKEPYDPEGS